MKAILVVGLGFGDEGKGATVEWLAKEHEADLVVRFNGGHQAGHRVELIDGRSHVFSQFGAATFYGAGTHHTRHSIIEPRAMKREAEALIKQGVTDPFKLLSVDGNCLVTPFPLKMLNRLREAIRYKTSKHHGSCGVGIGETKNYYLKYGLDAIRAADLHDSHTLQRKLELVHSRVLDEVQKLVFHNDSRTSELLAALHKYSPCVDSRDLDQMTNDLTINRVPIFKTAIFEGAQGVLLDERFGFHPYTTWSTTTYKWAEEFLQMYHSFEWVKVGVIRSYHTRHGQGPFPSEGKMNEKYEEGNKYNDWQGAIRYGALDINLLRYAIEIVKPDYLAVNHMDQYMRIGQVAHSQFDVDPGIVNTLHDQEHLLKLLQKQQVKYQPLNRGDFLDQLDRLRPIAIVGNGPTSADRTKYRELSFRN